MKFESINLGNIISEVIDYRGKTPKKLGADWSDEGIMAISAKNIKTGKIVQPDTIRYVTEELYEKWMKQKVTKGTILITSEAPFGQIYYWNTDEKVVLSQRLFGIKIKPEFDSRYIYYYMTTQEFQNELSGRATGSTVKGLRQPELLKCIIKVPDYKYQKKIADIISSFDDKIDNNNKINDLFQKIIGYCFSKVESDDNCTKTNLGSIIDRNKEKIKEKKDWKDLRILDLSVMPKFNICLNDYSNGDDFDSNIYKLKRKDIMYGSIRPYFGKCCISPFDGGFAGTVYSFLPKDRKYYSLVLANVSSKKFIDYTVSVSKGTKMPVVSWDDIEKYVVKIPSDELLNKFNSQVDDIVESILANINLNKYLNDIKLQIFNKIMNGKIDLDSVSI